MAVKLNFNTQITRRMPIRTAPTKFLSSKLRGHVERSEGIRPADAFYPYKCLPAMFIDTELQDAVVIPKGTIVSLLTSQSNSSVSPSGITEVGSSGVIPVFEDARSTQSAIITTNIDDGYWGYPDAVAGLLVPANGGVQSRIPYSADDATVGTFTCSGLVVTAAMGANPESNYCLVDANMPVGIAFGDVYQDIRGKYINYQIWEIWGILCDFYIEVPYVDINNVTTFASGYMQLVSEHAYNLNATNDAGYIATWKQHAFMYIDGTGGQFDGQAGQLVCPDINGKFIPQGATATTAATAQTVGKLILVDSRYPKDMLELVDTYPGSQMPGTETGGLPATLFNFVRDSEFGIQGVYPTIDNIVDYVQAGNYGLARIQLNI